jgi:hypothetical protein
MYFRDLQDRLIDIARFRVRSGELTERGLARLSGISQPHMHHVLNNLRLLSTEATDRLMKALDLSVPDVLWRSAAEPGIGVRAIPVVRDRIGPASEGILAELAGYYPFPERMLRDLVDPIAARLGPDLAMPNRLAVRDLVLLDQNPRFRISPTEEGALWMVKQGAGLAIRCIRMSDTHLHLTNESVPARQPQYWQSMALAGQNILEIVRAKIVWIGREVETEPARPPYPAGTRHRSHW